MPIDAWKGDAATRSLMSSSIDRPWCSGIPSPSRLRSLPRGTRLTGRGPAGRIHADRHARSQGFDTRNGRGSMPKWLRMFALPLVALSLVAAACGDDEGSGDGGGEPTDGAAAECNSDLTVGVALDVGGLGDNGFNDLSKIGLEQGDRRRRRLRGEHRVHRGELRGHEPRREHAVAGRGGLRRRRSAPDSRSRQASTRSRPTTRTHRSASSTATRHAAPRAVSTTRRTRSPTLPTWRSRRSRAPSSSASRRV